MNSRNDSSEIGTIVTGKSQRSSQYTGRFAPSPTGPLHLGSLLAAVASYLEARAHGGRWLLRIEDIDPPREQPGATGEILAALDSHGFEWDGLVSYQSDSRAAHEAAIRALLETGMAYRCGCSRRDLASSPRGPLGTIYPGTCRNGTKSADYALRVRTDAVPVEFEDRLQGRQTHALESESGDFVILRRDGLIAYQLAVVVDDHLQAVTDVVRGIDLLASTPRQVWLQQLLGYSSPRYCHIPVAINQHGQKLSKSHGAAGIAIDTPQANLVAALRLLRQEPPNGLLRGDLRTLWEWAITHWNIGILARQTEIPADFQAVADD